MANAVQKIVLSSSRDIPFDRLVLSQANVRRIKAGVSIEELAEDIARRTLLQSLSVRAIRDADGQETGRFEVPAGGRRFRALELLVKQKRLAKTAPVPCVLREGGLAEEDSLAENVQRAPLHPLDQFRAFRDLRAKGQSEEEIAAVFCIGVNVVKQRLRLAAVSETLQEVYAEDCMTLEQLMAFTVSNDHARQEQVWKGLERSYSREPYQIRRLLTETAVRAYDRRARFVGLEPYEAAGGVVVRDLFSADDDGGWLESVGLLDDLVAGRLKTEAEAIAAEGWKWVSAAAEFPYGHTQGLRALAGERTGLTPEDRAAIEALNAEYETLEAEYEGAEELPDAIDQRLGKIETALGAFERRPVLYDPVEIARAGVFVSLDAEGDLVVERGFVRPEDEPAVDVGGDPAPEDGEAASARGDADSPQGPPAVIRMGVEADAEPEEDDFVRPLPERLLGELSAHRTLALRDALAASPEVALTALLHGLCLGAFQHAAAGGCLEASVRHIFFPVQAPDLKDSPCAKAVAERHAAWKAALPADEDALWDHLAGLDDGERLALLAHCVSYGVNALHEKVDRYGGPGLSAQSLGRRLAQADRLARAVGLDMVAAGWRPTAGSYLGRVTKPRILEAVREARGDSAAQLIDHLKKAEMAQEAERLLEGSGWLPESLRQAVIDPAGGSPAAAVAALPDFLTGGGGETPDVDTAPIPAPAIAAE
jgi:ParB family chromosome partitioning protein